MTCPVCGNIVRTRRLVLDRATLGECAVCGHLVTLESARRISADAYGGDGSLRAAYEHAYLKARLASYARGLVELGAPEGRTLLDFGCNYGHFVRAAAEGGWRTYGYEPGQTLRRSALPDVSERILGSLEDVYRITPVDVVTLWDVLEHIEAPDAVLQDIAGLLRPRGLLLVRVPDARVFRQLTRLRWRPIRQIYLKFCHPTNPEEHFNHFTPQSLSAVAGRAGFRELVRLDAQRDERVAAGRTAVDTVVRRGLHTLGGGLHYEFTQVFRLGPSGGETG